MKTLKDFIKESQEINESLFGDIVRKLLDTGLSWISGSIKWIANKSADAVSDIWKTHRDVLTNTYSEFRRSNPKYKFLPETPKTDKEYSLSLLITFLNDSVSADDKITLANTVISAIKKEKDNKHGKTDNSIAEITANCYIGITKNPKATGDDKTKADNFLNTIISTYGDGVKVLINERINDLKKHI